jgi:dimethylhistidine N-methyltransferase
METTTELRPLIDQSPAATDSFREAALEGLARDQKEIPSKFLYDERGSELFDKICRQEEYYSTRTEMSIMKSHVDAMVKAIGPRAQFVEYGSGSSLKTRILLDHLEDLAVYVPMDISCRYLKQQAEELAEAYPDTPIQPLCADYTAEFTLPEPPRPARRTVVYYPGSTIGNFQPADARAFLSGIRSVVGAEGGLLIGVDLLKDRDVIKAAYNDSAGVTAAFNKNLLRRMNRELDAGFDLDQFEHEGRWNPEEGCIEMHLCSTTVQTVEVAGTTFSFAEGETILTEYSYKYTLDDFAALAAEAGFEVDTVWTDEQSYFSVQYCTAA